MRDVNINQYRKLANTKSYDIVLSELNPKNEFCGVVFDEMKVTYKEVRFISMLLKKGTTWNDIYEVFEIMYGVSEDLFYYSSIVDYYSCRNYIFKFISDLHKRESNLLQSIDADSELWKAAGGDRLNKHSYVMPLIQLGERFNLYPLYLEDKPYNEILTLLKACKDKGEVQQSFDRLKRQV